MGRVDEVVRRNGLYDDDELVVLARQLESELSNEKSAIGKMVIHRVTRPDTFVAGKWTNKTEDRKVRLLTIWKCWAMVRRPRCMPYVCHVDELITSHCSVSTSI